MLNTPIVVTAGIVVLVATILVLVAGRREPDTERSRTLTRYLDAVALLSTFVVLFAGYAIVAELSRFFVNANHRGDSAIDSVIGAASGRADPGVPSPPPGRGHPPSGIRGHRRRAGRPRLPLRGVLRRGLRHPHGARRRPLRAVPGDRPGGGGGRRRDDRPRTRDRGRGVAARAGRGQCRGLPGALE